MPVGYAERCAPRRKKCSKPSEKDAAFENLKTGRWKRKKSTPSSNRPSGPFLQGHPALAVHSGAGPGNYNVQLTKSYDWRYLGGMKIKTSITLSDEIIKAIDTNMGNYRSRSEFIETAARNFINQLKKKEAEQRDLEIINQSSDTLNDEAEDVLGYQVPL